MDLSGEVSEEGSRVSDDRRYKAECKEGKIPPEETRGEGVGFHHRWGKV